MSEESQGAGSKVRPTAWDHLARTIERWHPVVLALLVAFVVRSVFAQRPVPPVAQIFSSTVDLGAITIGFLGTAMAVVLSIQGTKVGSFMRTSGLYSSMMWHTIWALVWATLTVAVSLTGIVVESVVCGNETCDHPAKHVAFIVWAFSLTGGALSALGVIRQFFGVLHPNDPNLLA